MHYSQMIENEMRAALYVTKGHAQHAPGLRGHSLGGTYPLTVIAIGNPHDKLEFAAYDCRTGNTGHRRPTYKAAEIDLHAVRVRNLINE